MGKSIKDNEVFSINPALQQIGIVIQQERKKRGLTQAQMVNLIGGNQGDYANIELGKRNVTLKTLLAVFNILKLNLSLADEWGKTYRVVSPLDTDQAAE